jgi:hypothetical protein
MTKSAFRLGLLAWALVLPAMGCGGGKSCEALCTEARACPDASPSETTCKDLCTAQDKLVKAAKCETQRAELDACVSGLKDACDAATGCSTEAKASYACTNNYCDKNPDACGGG